MKRYIQKLLPQETLEPECSLCAPMGIENITCFI